jgi:hypothetical protein
MEKEDKPWFSETCKTKYREYKNALHEFNTNKTIDSHVYLIRKKKEYRKWNYDSKDNTNVTKGI